MRVTNYYDLSLFLALFVFFVLREKGKNILSEFELLYTTWASYVSTQRLGKYWKEVCCNQIWRASGFTSYFFIFILFLNFFYLFGFCCWISLLGIFCPLYKYKYDLVSLRFTVLFLLLLYGTQFYPLFFPHLLFLKWLSFPISINSSFFFFVTERRVLEVFPRYSLGKMVNFLLWSFWPELKEIFIFIDSKDTSSISFLKRRSKKRKKKTRRKRVLHRF